jgi:hypothetical protein
MDAHELSYLIRNIQADKEHHNDRRVLHENYEWLEHYWRYKYRNGDNSINDFIVEKGKFYWGLEIIRNFAREFASMECVGSNKNDRYAQTDEIARATMYLRYSCNLLNEETPTCNLIKCRPHKIGENICIKENALLWKRSFDSTFAFKALLYIVRQIRNNLFHGHKLSLEPEQFERNKILVRLSAQVTGILLDNLVESGNC